MNTLSQDRPRVLIVDDQKNWREALYDMLNPMYEVETAASYDEAEHKLRQRAFHVLVADQRLVDADEINTQGILLLGVVSELRDGTQAIIVTGYPTIETAKEALRGRDAYDYILKYPEEGGPFNIRQYLERVRGAAEKAMLARQKATTLDFSVSALGAGLTYAKIAQSLSPGKTPDAGVLANVTKVINRLFYTLQPLAHGMSRVRSSEADQAFEILCWSRGCGKAALLRIIKGQASLDTRESRWLSQSWQLIERERFSSGSLVGISHIIDDMTFEDFAALVGED